MFKVCGYTLDSFLRMKMNSKYPFLTFPIEVLCSCTIGEKKKKNPTEIKKKKKTENKGQI